MDQLRDRFGRTHTYLRISLTDRCNLRCRYCMPASGFPAREEGELLVPDEIERLCRLFALLGVTKVRLTGGEPLVRQGVPALVARIAAIPGIQTVGLTTNGILLFRQAEKLRRAGLDRLNVSLDSLRPDRFTAITRRPGFQKVLAGIEAALAAGFTPLKLNVVVMRGVNDGELCDFVELARRRPVNVRFIEYMPFRENHWSEAGFVSYGEMKEWIAQRHPLIPLVTGERGSVARDFKIDGFAGAVSFITSVSHHFCDDCTRLRLTADGRMKTCLFTSAALPLLPLLRGGAGDEEIAAAVTAALAVKPAAHASTEELIVRGGRSMTEIGG